MKLRIVLILLASIGAKELTYAQKADSAKSKLLLAAREIIGTTTTCALITLDEKGMPRVRSMDPFAPETDFTIWLATNPKSRKVAEIKKNPMVTLFYQDKSDQGYVSIRATAQLVNDQREKDKRWKEAWKDFLEEDRPRQELSLRRCRRC